MNIFVDCIGISKKATRASFGIYRYVINIFKGIKIEKDIDINLKIIIVKEDIESYNFLLDDKRFELIIIDNDIKSNISYFNVLKNDLKKIVEKENFPLFIPRGYFLCNIKNEKILIVHDIIPYFFWKKNFNIKSLFIWHKIKDSIRKSNKVIFISLTTFSNVLNLYKNKEIFSKIYILNNSLEFTDFKDLENDRNSQKYFLTFYSKYNHKGYDKVIEAFTKYKKLGGKNELYVVGAIYESYSNNIKYLKYLNDVELYKLYRDASGFISLSEIEGFGYPVIEASYWGIPVILSSIPIYYETLYFYENAYFTSPYDINEIVKTLFKVEKEFKIDSNFKKVIYDRYNISKIVKNFSKIIKNK